MELPKGKFVIAYDTIVDGHQTQMDENNNPITYDTFNEAFKELFSDAHSMLSNRTDEELVEYNEDVTPEMVTEMGKVLESGDVYVMKKFLDKYPQCNDNGDWVESTDTFMLNHKTIYTGE